MNIFAIYTGTSPNGKKYVGLTKNFTSRVTEHRRAARRGSLLAVHSAIRKYGSKFKFEVIFNTFTLENAKWAEMHLIKELNTFVPNGYNMTYGGDAVMADRHHTDETKLKISLGNTGKRISKETRAKMSAVKRGATFSVVHKERLTAARRLRPNKPHSEETRLKMSISKRGRRFTEQHKLKLSLAKRGLPSKNRKQVLCVETGEIFHSLFDASRAKKCSSAHISGCLSGNRKTCGGYHWQAYRTSGVN